MDEWEISFNLRAGDRSEHFQFNVNPVKDRTKELPSFPKDKFLRALKSHGESNQYNLHSGMITDLKIKGTSELHENQEIHILMLVMEKIGPISLIFLQTFEQLVLEGIDSHYNYIGSEALLNVLVQVIKPDSPTVKGLGKITSVYHASNMVELSRKESFVSFLDSPEGQILVFGLSIILPTVLIIILPIQILDSMLGYIISLGILAILWCIFPIAKRSTRYAPLSVISALASYLIIEMLINLNIIVRGINPWGIFSNLSRQELLADLQNQEVISELGYEVFLGIELLEVIMPFLDIIFIILIPFSVGVGLSGLFMITERKWKSATVLRVLFAALFIIAIITIPLAYHALGKGSEGTLHASIGLIETAEMFTPLYIQDLEANYEALLELIASAKQHLEKANNSFEQFGQNPLIAFILPYIMPEVAGIPLEDLPEILTLTGVLADTVPFMPNILWGYNNLQVGFNQTFYLLLQTIESLPQPGGVGSKIPQEYDNAMLDALKILQWGTNNLSSVETPILHLISEILKRKLDYSIFAEISNLLTELEVGLPILITIADNSVPWINSTYKLTLALDDIYDLNFASNILIEAERDFNASSDMQTLDIKSLAEDAIIPIRDLANFSLNLHTVTKYFMFSLKNASFTFQALNNTLYQIQGLNFSDSNNFQDQRWVHINQGLSNTSEFLKKTQSSLDSMSAIIDSQDLLDFEELAELNQLLENLKDFTLSASERVDIVEQYVSALNGTLQSVWYFSLGTFSLNETLTEVMGGGSFEPQAAILNFTFCQTEANQTYDELTNVRGQLLNDSAVDNWRDLVKGNITDDNTNSIYMNAERCLDLISDIEATQISPEDAKDDFQDFLENMELLDDKWDVFSL